MDENVKLHSLFGLHPFVSFLIKVALVVFLISFVPSLFMDSRRVYVVTDVYPLRVEIDGRNCGITPANAKLKHGMHLLKIYYGDNVVYSREFWVHHALFFSYIFEYHQKLKIDISLTETQKAEITADFLRDSILYSTLFHTDPTHIQKPYFSYYRSLLGDDADMGAVEVASRFIANADAAKDYKSAFDFNYAFSEFGDKLARRESPVALERRGGTKLVGGQKFIVFDKFLLMEKEVGYDLFNEFVQDCPEYSISNLANLAGNGLVDENYLLGTREGRSVSNVSMIVVEAFCSWFSGKYDVKARLLTKAEYAAAVAHASEFDKLDSGLYELTSSPFIPYEVMHGCDIDKSFITEYALSPNYMIFCFSDYNRKLPFDEKRDLVGVMAPDACYETVGFRIAIDETL